MNIVIGNFMLFGNSKFIYKTSILVFVFFFGCFTLKSQQLEEEIYKAIDDFVATKNLKKLAKKEIYFNKKVLGKNEKLALLILYCNKGFYLKNILKNKQAIESYEKAWSIFSKNKLSNYDIVEYCLKPLGNLYIINKDYTNAENTIKHYIFLAKKHNNTLQKASGIINLSLLYQSLGKHTQVVALVNSITDTFSTAQIKKLQRIKQFSAAVLKGGVKNYQKKYQEFKNKNNDSLPTRQYAKKTLEASQFLFLMDKKKEAKKQIYQVIKRFLPNVKSTNNIKKENLYAEPLLIDAFDLLAEITPDSLKKLNLYENSFYISKLLESNTTSQEVKIIHQTDQKKRSEKCISILYELYKKTFKVKYFKKALFYANSFKSGVLTKQMYKKILLQKYPSDTLLKKENKLAKLQEKLTNQLILKQNYHPFSLSVSKLGKQLTELSIRLKSVRKKIHTKYKIYHPYFNYLHKVEEKLTKNNLTLINYFLGKTATYQFVMQGKEKQIYKIKLPVDEIVGYIRFFNKPSAINNNIQKFKEASFLLYKKLNIKTVCNKNNLLLIPDGLLNFVPFETLLTQPTNSINFSEMPFLVKNKQIIYNVNTNSFLRKKQKNNYNNVLGVFPVFANSSLELRYSLNEEKAIKKAIKSTSLIKAKATKNNFIKKANYFDILHFSTHAVGNSLAPYIQFYNSKLTLNELYALDLHSNLAVLSACETGVGTLKKGEGAMSIARGFRYAGVKNILFSLWEINDKYTSVLMHYFYNSVSKSKSISYANWKSKIAYLNSNKIKNDKKSPYYWGAFVYYGAFETKNNSFSFWIFIMVVAVVFLIFKNKFGIIKLFKKR